MLIFNPFSFVLNSGNDYENADLKNYAGGRTLLNAQVDTTEMSSVTIQKIISWSLNASIVIFCLFKIYFYGHPTISEEDEKPIKNNYNKANKSLKIVREEAQMSAFINANAIVFL